MNIGDVKKTTLQALKSYWFLYHICCRTPTKKNECIWKPFKCHNFFFQV